MKKTWEETTMLPKIYSTRDSKKACKWREEPPRLRFSRQCRNAKKKRSLATQAHPCSSSSHSSPTNIHHLQPFGTFHTKYSLAKRRDSYKDSNINSFEFIQPTPLSNDIYDALQERPRTASTKIIHSFSTSDSLKKLNPRTPKQSRPFTSDLKARQLHSKHSRTIKPWGAGAHKSCHFGKSKFRPSSLGSRQDEVKGANSRQNSEQKTHLCEIRRRAFPKDKKIKLARTKSIRLKEQLEASEQEQCDVLTKDVLSLKSRRRAEAYAINKVMRNSFRKHFTAYLNKKRQTNT